MCGEISMTRNLIPIENRPNYYVYILESPNQEDTYEGRSEGRLLKESLELNSIPHSYRNVVNKEMFEKALKSGLLEEQMKRDGNMIPIIHISAHGNDEGIGLTAGDFVSWQELKGLIAIINQASGGILFLCLSSCEGFNACEMAMEIDGELPYFALVSHVGKPTWSDAAVAYTSFYHLINKGYYIKDAVNGMKEASGDIGFDLTTAADTKERFIKKLNERVPQSFSAALQQGMYYPPALGNLGSLSSEL